MTVGTFCSGTDCAIEVLKSFLKSCSATLEIPEEQMPDLTHLFSCEKDHQKQDFLKKFCPSMQSLHEDAVEPLDLQCAYLSAGFPCDDASALHPKSSSVQHRTCVSEELVL